MQLSKSGSCYLCGSQTEFFMEKAGYRIIRCPSCHLAATEFDKPYEKFTRSFYNKGYFTGDPSCGAYSGYKNDREFVMANLKQQLKYLEPFVQSGKILDVGCAMGFFIEAALQKGFDAYGFDPSTFARAEARPVIRNRIQVATINTAKYKPRSFDAVTMFDVIEHVNYPIESLEKIRTFLKPGGYLLMATGDKESLAAKVWGKHWTFYNPPQHLFFYTQNNLKEMLKRSGFTPIIWFRIGKWLSLSYIFHLAYSAAGLTFFKPLAELSQKSNIGRLPLFVPMRDNISVIAKRI
jgi:SAM-dependent methyltransferase